MMNMSIHRTAESLVPLNKIRPGDTIRCGDRYYKVTRVKAGVGGRYALIWQEGKPMHQPVLLTSGIEVYRVDSPGVDRVGGVVEELLASHRIKVDQELFSGTWSWGCSCDRVAGEAGSFEEADAAGRAHVAWEVVVGMVGGQTPTVSNVARNTLY